MLGQLGGRHTLFALGTAGRGVGAVGLAGRGR